MPTIVDHDPVVIASRNYDMSKQEFAETVGVAVRSLYLAPERRTQKVRSRTREAIELINRISHLAGGHRQALAWYRSEPIPAFGDRTAEALVKDGKAAAVRDWIDHVATGGFA